MSGRRGAARVITRLLSFFGVWLVSSLSSFVLLPVLARQVSVGEWTAVAVGQSIGSVAGLATSFGWNVAGPARVARGTEEQRLAEYASSLRVRGTVFACTLPISASLSFLLAPDHVAVAWLMGAAWSVNGLTAIWFNVGEGRARDAIYFDVVPKGIATVAAAVLLVRTQDPFWYPLLLIVATAIGTTWFSLTRFPEGLGSAAMEARSLPAMRANVNAALSDFVSGAFNASVVAVARPTASTGQLALYASADKAYRMGTQVITSVSNAFQGWVAEPEGDQGRRRRQMALTAHTVMAVLGGIFFAALGPWATGVLYGPTLRASRPTSLWLAVGLLLLCLTTSIGRHVLLPTDRVRVIMAGSLIGLATALAAIPILASIWGSDGIAAGVALAQVATLVRLTRSLWKDGI